MPTPPCKKKEVQTSEYPKVTQLLDKRGAVIGVVVQCAPHADDWVKYRPSPREPRSGSWEAGPFAEPLDVTEANAHLLPADLVIPGDSR